MQKFTWSFTSDSNSVPILVNFSNQDLYLYSGCNQISKRIEIHHNHLKSKGQQIQTLMGCGLLQAQEELATRIFNDSKLEIHSNKINQKKLKVVLKDGSSYTFLGITLIPDLKNYNSELLKKFTWKQITDDGSHPLLLNFKPDRMSFFSSCNRLGRNYHIDDHHIIPLGDIGSPVKYCPQLYPKEKQLMRFISDPLSFQLDHSQQYPQLILKDKNKEIYIFHAIKYKEVLYTPDQ